MDQRSTCGHVVFLSYFFLAINLTISHLALQTAGRYLRPDDHGLAFQNATTPAKGALPQMLSFFNARQPASSQSIKPLAEDKNLTTVDGGENVWWNRRKRPRPDTHSRNNLRKVLIVGSLVCGLAGCFFLVVSALIILFRYRKRRWSSPESTSAIVLTSDATVSGTAKL